ncbi:hypothetical protein KKI24_12845 [bacterium]|nr:hypothetical protein [bacterium]
MNNDRKRAILQEIYRIHQDWISGQDLACTIRCADCCTRNVTMTSLEGLNIVQKLDDARRGQCLQRLSGETGNPRFSPKITVNGMAERCAKGEALPEENLDPGWGRCPLLVADQCSIYPDRPFECRALVSRKSCRASGFADMPPVTVAVNTLFRQYIEHIDADGTSGNLMDVLLQQLGKQSPGLIANRPITILMIDPAFKSELDPILETLNTIRV